MIFLKYYGSKLKATVAVAMVHCMNLMGLHPETVLAIIPLYKFTAPTK